MMCLWGHISPQMLNKTMRLFKEDLDAHASNQLDVDGIAGLASMGSHGEHANNIWRDFKAWLPKPQLPSLYSVMMPFKHSVLGLMYRPTKMLLPHELFAAIYAHFPKMFTECLYPSAQVCTKFWNSVRGGVQFACHEVRHMGNLSKVIPLRLHGDGTPASGVGKSWGKLVDIFSLSSMLVFGSSQLHNFMIWMVHQSLLCWLDQHHTMNKFWKVFAWSMTALKEGRWPTKDAWNKPIHSSMAGKSLMGGFTAYIWGVIGDLDYFTKTLELPNSNSGSPCALCPCNSTDVPWWDFRLLAEWIRRIYTPAEWLAAGWDRCGLFRCPGVNVYSIYPDWMHIKHLGIDKVLLGSVLWLLINCVLPGNDLSAKLAVIWSDILNIYAADNVSCRYGNLKLTMFSTGSTPKLKGKAAEIKCMGPVLSKVWDAYMDTNLPMHDKISILLKMSAHLDTIVDRNASEFALNDDEATDLIATGFGYLSLFREVAEMFRNCEVALFSITAKAHYLAHSCLLSRCFEFSCQGLCMVFY